MVPTVAGRWVLSLPVAGGGGQGPIAEVARRGVVWLNLSESNARGADELSLSGNRCDADVVGFSVSWLPETAGGRALRRPNRLGELSDWLWYFLLVLLFRDHDRDEREVLRGSTEECAEQAAIATKFGPEQTTKCSEFLADNSSRLAEASNERQRISDWRFGTGQADCRKKLAVPQANAGNAAGLPAGYPFA